MLTAYSNRNGVRRKTRRRRRKKRTRIFGQRLEGCRGCGVGRWWSWSPLPKGAKLMIELNWRWSTATHFFVCVLWLTGSLRYTHATHVHGNCICDAGAATGILLLSVDCICHRSSHHNRYRIRYLQTHIWRFYERIGMNNRNDFDANGFGITPQPTDIRSQIQMMT